MKEKKILMIISVITAFIITIISLDCGIFAGNTSIDSGRTGGFHELIRRVQTATADYLILIDPGHGGMDGGASGNDGTLEKNINLAIAEKLAKTVEQYKCAAVLTRENDNWLCETEEGSIRSRKTADLKARRELIRKYNPDITVSIHLNSFKEDPGVNGAQVFYPSKNGSEEVLQQCRALAETIQEKMNETLQKEEPRTAIVRDGVFIFKEVERPMIIIECGFISNPEEAEKLKTDKYQQELAQCIVAGIAEFAGLEKLQKLEITDSLR